MSKGSRVPPVWDEEALAAEAARALDEFAARRLAEPATRYPEHVADARRAIVTVLQRLKRLDDSNASETIGAIIGDKRLYSAFRYLAGPPISADDLSVLVTKSTARLSRSSVTGNARRAKDILDLVCRIADAARFPWLAGSRRPTQSELRQAILATAVLMATQWLQTERRGYGREIEAQLRRRLSTEGFEKVDAPNSGRIDKPTNHPRPRQFYGECTLRGRKTDLLIGLADGRAVAVEAKDSSSVVNSVKRVLNDTAAKAQLWKTKCGEDIVPVALLSGVFNLSDLASAQKSGLYLVFAHDLDAFTDWLASQ